MKHMRNHKCSVHDRDEKYDNYDLIIRYNLKFTWIK